MNERGWVAISRDIFKDEVFEPEPFTKVQAWIWLITEAEYEPRMVPIKCGGHHSTIRLSRGELCHTYGYMAEAWGWTYKNVRTFISYLRKNGKIGHASGSERGTDRTIISIIKFDAWQFGAKGQGTPSVDDRAHLGQLSGNPRATKQTTLTTSTKEIDIGAAGSMISPEAFSLSDEVLGLSKADKTDPLWFGFPYVVQSLLSEGITRETVLSACATSPVKNPRYFEKTIRSTWERRDAIPPPSQRQTVRQPSFSDLANDLGNRANEITAN